MPTNKPAADSATINSNATLLLPAGTRPYGLIVTAALN